MREIFFVRPLETQKWCRQIVGRRGLEGSAEGAASLERGLNSCCSKENMAMTTFNLAPLYRSTVGYDRLFDMLSDSIRPDWPPYNIEKMGENDYRISMAVAGFGADEIELTQHGTSLLIAGQKKADGAKHQMLHQGISSRNFKQTFSLADHVKVAAATMENGLLSIDLVREVPEALKPRTIEITSGAGKVAAPETAPVQIGPDSDVKRKAA